MKYKNKFVIIITLRHVNVTVSMSKHLAVLSIVVNYIDKSTGTPCRYQSYTVVSLCVYLFVCRLTLYGYYSNFVKVAEN